MQANAILAREQKYRDQESQDIIAWISPLNFARKQIDFFGRRQEGTGQWFLEDSKFKRWLRESGETLWCPGLRKISLVRQKQFVDLFLTQIKRVPGRQHLRKGTLT